MDLRQLKYLVTLAKEHHFARAAEICFVTQPTLSARIRQLEDEFGVPLVVRDHRYRGLTRYGDRVVEWATSVLGDCDALKQDFSRIRQGGEGVISVGIIPSASPLASLLLSFLRLRDVPVDADIKTLSADEVVRQVAQKNISLGITYKMDLVDDVYRSIPIAPETYVALKFGEVDSAQPKKMDWADLSSHDLCLPSDTVPGRSVVDACLQEHCEGYHASLETDCWLTMLQAVRRNGLLGIAPSHVVGILTLPEGTSVFPLPVPKDPLELVLIAERSESEDPVVGKVLSALEGFPEFLESESTDFDRLN